MRGGKVWTNFLSKQLIWVRDEKLSSCYFFIPCLVLQCSTHFLELRKLVNHFCKQFRIKEKYEKLVIYLLFFVYKIKGSVFKEVVNEMHTHKKTQTGTRVMRRQIST